MVALSDAQAIPAFAASASIKGFLPAKQALDELQGHELFANPLRPCEQNGMGQLVSLDEALKVLDLGAVADDFHG